MGIRLDDLPPTTAALLAAARDDGTSTALCAPGRRATGRAALSGQVRRTVGQLRAAGVARDGRVAVVLPDGPDLAAAFLGISAAAACAPLNPGYTVAELAFSLPDLGAELVVVASGGHPAAEAAAARTGRPVLRLSPLDGAGRFTLVRADGSELPVDDPGEPPAPDDLALLLHTSGTTARPKLVGLRHRSLLGSAAAVARTLELSPTDRSLLVMPLFHVHGLVAGLLAPLLAGGEVWVPSGFTSGDLAALVETSGATWLTAVPTMLQALLDQVEQRPLEHRLRIIRSCSAALPPPVAAGLERRLGVPVIEAYGMTEGAHQIASNPPPPADRKAGSVGVATGPAMAVVDGEGRPLPVGEVGEVVLRGGSVIDGYLDNPEADAASFRDGWFRTGDLGRLDEDGYLFLAGRIKELVNRAGEKITPREVEEVLGAHPAVATAVVFGVPDRRLGEQVAAAVVARSPVTERELRLFASERLAPFKVPRRIVLCDEIPKGPTGKLARRGLAERFGLADLDDTDGADDTSGPRPPEGPAEELLAELWSEVLGRPVTDAHARFLELGGDSLAAMRLLTRVRQELDLELTMVDFFDAPTVAQQGGVVERMLLQD